MHTPRPGAARGALALSLVLLGACGGGMAGAMETAPRPSAGAPMPAADRDMQAVLDQLAALGARPVETLSVEQARAQPSPADAVKALLRQQERSTAPEPVGSVRDRTVPGPAGPIPVRVYTPAGTGPFPVIVYVHGGGWVIANLDTYDASARALANAANAVVVSVEYRHAPEHKFPAAHEDTWAAYRWVVANAAQVGGDPERIAVAGESAGGNMAANLSIRARDEGVKLPVHQLLVYPVAGTDMNTPSYLQNADAKPLSRGGMMWFARHTLRSPADAADRRLNLVAANLTGLPPTTIIAAEIDPLRSEGSVLAERLRAAGVDVDYQSFEGAAHEFFGMGAVVGDARDAVIRAGARLRASFARGGM